jgi:hypothetical protein
MVARTLSDWSPEDADQSIRILQRLEQSVDELVGSFQSAAAAGTDPLTTAAVAGPTPQNQAPSELHNEAQEGQPMTNWETTAV